MSAWDQLKFYQRILEKKKKKVHVCHVVTEFFKDKNKGHHRSKLKPLGADMVIESFNRAALP